MDYFKQKVYFSTLTIQDWTPIFKDFPFTNFIVLNSFKFIVDEKAVQIYGFVIMRDHIHLIWEVPESLDVKTLVGSFKRFTANRFLKYLNEINAEYLNNFSSSRKDRKHKFWKEKSSNFRITHHEIYKQKLEYLHKNPISGIYKTIGEEEDYLFSSALAYSTWIPNFGFLTLNI